MRKLFMGLLLALAIGGVGQAAPNCTIRWRVTATNAVASGQATATFGTPLANNDFLVYTEQTFTQTLTCPTNWTAFSCSPVANSIPDDFQACFRTWHTGDATTVTTNLSEGFPKVNVWDLGPMEGTDGCSSVGTGAATTSFTIPAVSATVKVNECYMALVSSDQDVVSGLTDLDQVNYDNHAVNSWGAFDGIKTVPTAGTAPNSEAITTISGNSCGFGVTIITNSSAVPSPNFW